MPRFSGVPIDSPIEQAIPAGGRFGGIPETVIGIESIPTQAALDLPVGQDGFISRVSEDIKSRQLEVSDTIGDLIEGRIGAIEGGIQLAGKGIAGPMLDVVGEGVVSIGKGLSFITGDIGKSVVDTFKEGFSMLSQTDAGKLAAEAIRGGLETYNEFKEKNPQTARTVESIANIGILFAPVKVKAKAEPTIIGSFQEKIGKLAGKQISKRRKVFIDDLITPKTTQKQRIADVSRTVEEGLLKKGVVLPSTREIEIAKEVSRIKTVTPKNTFQGNFNAIHTQNRKLQNQLINDLSKSKIIIPRQDVIDNIENAVIKVIDDNPIIVGNLEITAKKVSNKAIQILNKSPETPSGLLRARKDFDNWVRTLPQGEKKLGFEATMEAQSITIKSVRNSMNDILDSRVQNASVKKELKRHSLLYDALDRIELKAAEEYGGVIGRSIQNIAKVLPIRTLKETMLIATGGLGSLYFASKITPMIPIIAVTGLATVGTYKFIISPTAKKWTGKLLKQMDRAILSSKNPSMIRQLRADRALVIEMLENSEVTEEQ